LNAIVDATGSLSANVTADSVILDQAGGPQPQLGPFIFSAQQNVYVNLSGGQPGSQVVVHCNGVWDDSYDNAVNSIATLSGGTIGAQQIVGTAFQQSQTTNVNAGATYTSPIYPMLGYSAVLMQYIVTLGSLTVLPTVTLQWLDGATPPNVIYQSNWQSQKIIDTIASWGPNMQLTVLNNDNTHPLAIQMTLVPVAATPFPKAASLTYRQTALNEILSIHNQACTSGNSLYATTAAGLGWSGPATLYVNPNFVRGAGEWNPDYAFQLACAPAWSGSGPYTAIGAKKILVNYPTLCPIAVEQIDLIDQPLMMSFTNNGVVTVTPDLSVTAGYR
jgi:hypothetical protein